MGKKRRRAKRSTIGTRARKSLPDFSVRFPSTVYGPSLSPLPLSSDTYFYPSRSNWSVRPVAPSPSPKPVQRLSQVPTYVGTSTGDNARVRVCQARAERAQVLHAKGKAGKRGQRRPVLRPSSKVKCK